MAQQLKIAKEQVPSDAPFPAPVEASWMVGTAYGYDFTREDYMAAVPELKALYDAAGASGHYAASRQVADASGFDSGQIADALGWEDGAAGALLGDMINSYWNANAENWGVPTPSEWVSGIHW
ncbi:MAG TPA: hypothetical protein VFP84_31075 [Kofleriaceae bacterium]|nr:hypothetical protein [Kofleriaceae bacterium]